MGENRTSFSDDQTGWRALCAPRESAPSLTKNLGVRFAVVGAGFTGLAAARELALLCPDDEVVVLDARGLAAGASGRNAGYAVGVSQFGGKVDKSRYHECHRINRLNHEGLALLRQAAAPAASHNWWQESGYHYLAADDRSEKEAEYFRDNLLDFELPHRELDCDAIEREIGTRHYRCGVQVPLGALVQPAELLYRLVERLPANVRVFENTPVHAIEQRSEGLELMLNGGFRLNTQSLVLACNYELPGLGFLRNRIAATTLSGSFTRPLSDDEMASMGSLESWGVLGLHGGGATVRLTQDRRVMLRNCVEFNNGQFLPAEQLARRVPKHRDRLLKRFPQLAHVPIEHSWSGCEGVSRNMTSFFGQYASNIYLSAGYNGSGLSRGTAMGTALARLILGGDDALIRDASGFAKAQWLPPRPLLDVGAAWSLRQRFAGVGEDI
ncbi:MAG: NAD(P)/FAD-dependent oxidoreductase [Granulosicoccaceae bacterium]